MSQVTGAELLVASLKRQGVDTVFLLMGGPLESTVNVCSREGLRLVDTRHEQGAAMMAHGYAREFRAARGSAWSVLARVR